MCSFAGLPHSSDESFFFVGGGGGWEGVKEMSGNVFSGKTDNFEKKRK